ncbi:hypothetical protein RJ639_004084 [Escallonia herrerae]|uniref:Peptidase A1 domain-containing protein n=1 Tax=Escallonia herrerae TaxID=1293975 RepID=A0AA88W4U9_9ASTE|nr:hypothetical protein RJ639_004084 [Escallonia herrerae]
MSSFLAQASFRPKALVLSVTKDSSTLRYLTRINQRTPLVPVSLTLDLGGQFLWVDCEKDYVSSTYRPARCRSAQCNLAGSTARLAAGVKGMAGLGRAKISIPSQLSAYFSFPKKFAICLSSSTSARGVVLLGNGPYVLLPNVDASPSLIYTPLFINPTEGDASPEYFIRVKSIKINEKVVPLDANFLSINKTNGYEGTKISTVNLFTVLGTSIYNAVVKAFSGFRGSFWSHAGGPAVPQIDLVLQSETVYWRIFGANSMVQVSNDVLCLGFGDGGANPRTSIVIGGHKIEDNLLQFDLATSRLGFSSSLLFRQTTCANFNFTSNA